MASVASKPGNKTERQLERLRLGGRSLGAGRAGQSYTLDPNLTGPVVRNHEGLTQALVGRTTAAVAVPMAAAPPAKAE